MPNPEETLEKLRKAGMKQTPQRIEVVRTLLEIGEKHPSLNQLYQEAKKRIPTLSFSTLYTTIKKLEELGLIRLFDLLGETRVEINTKPHINIIDITTGEIRDYEDEELTKKIEIITGRHRFILVNILVYPEENTVKPS